MRLKLITAIRKISINSCLNTVIKCRSSNRSIQVKDFFPWNFSQMITRTVPISRRITKSCFPNQKGYPILRLKERRYKLKQQHFSTQKKQLRKKLQVQRVEINPKKQDCKNYNQWFVLESQQSKQGCLIQKNQNSVHYFSQFYSNRLTNLSHGNQRLKRQISWQRGSLKIFCMLDETASKTVHK